MSGLPNPTNDFKHRFPLLLEASGTILVVKLGLNMLRGVEHTTDTHKFVRQCSGNPGSSSAGAIDVIK